MIISKVGYAVGANSKSKASVNYKNNSAYGRNKTNNADKVSFGMDPITATILQEAAEAAAKGLWGIHKLRKTIEKAEYLFNKFDVKPAIETAIQLDAKYGKKHSVSTGNLIDLAIEHVGKLSDSHKVNRDLKQRVVDHCYLDQNYSFENIESLFIGLNNNYYMPFKKYILKNLASQNLERYDLPGKGLLLFDDIDSVTKGVGDTKFRSMIKRRRVEQIKELENGEQKRIDDMGDGYPGQSRV